MDITVMSFNIQHCRNFMTREIDYDSFVEEIRKRNADIIGLNEVRGKGDDPRYEDQARILAEKLGYYCYFARAIFVKGNNPYGNAILSKYPILSAETIMIPDPDPHGYDGYYESRCILKASIDVCGGLNVLVSHFGLNPDEQENAVKSVLENMEQEKSILMGDFNMAPDQPMIKRVREGLYDTADLFDENLLSWPSDQPQIRIDYMFAPRDIRVKAADIPADIVSDHRPYVVIISTED